jgi:chromosome segregation ATPase
MKSFENNTNNNEEKIASVTENVSEKKEASLTPEQKQKVVENKINETTSQLKSITELYQKNVGEMIDFREQADEKAIALRTELERLGNERPPGFAEKSIKLRLDEKILSADRNARAGSLDWWMKKDFAPRMRGVRNEINNLRSEISSVENTNEKEIGLEKIKSLENSFLEYETVLQNIKG